MATDKKPPAPPDRQRDSRRQEDTLVRERISRPRRFKVVFHNDDYTPMEFVVLTLEQVFHRSNAEANRIMLTVHTEGAGVAGVYPAEIAESKAQITIGMAREAGYPLLVTAEPE
jgi:ATP-dependent Clp protease adaptor protein ClpS